MKIVFLEKLKEKLANMKMDKDLLIKVLCINHVILLVLTLILSVCLIHSCATRNDYSSSYRDGYSDSDDDDDDDDDKGNLPNGNWIDLADPSNEEQKLTFLAGNINDEFEFRVNNHSKYIDTVAKIYGKTIDVKGKEMDISASVDERGASYTGEYCLTGIDILNAEFQLTPCKQDKLGWYQFEIDDFELEIQVKDCDAIRFDRNKGVTFEGVTGEWEFIVKPVREFGIDIAYGYYCRACGIASETSDISITWLTDGFKIVSSENVESLKVIEPQSTYTRAFSEYLAFQYTPEEVKKSYEIHINEYEEYDITKYSVTIE